MKSLPLVDIFVLFLFVHGTCLIIVTSFWSFVNHSSSVIFLIDDVVVLSRLGACLQRLLNKLYEICRLRSPMSAIYLGIDFYSHG